MTDAAPPPRGWEAFARDQVRFLHMLVRLLVLCLVALLARRLA